MSIPSFELFAKMLSKIFCSFSFEKSRAGNKKLLERRVVIEAQQLIRRAAKPEDGKETTVGQ